MKEHMRIYYNATPKKVQAQEWAQKDWFQEAQSEE